MSVPITPVPNEMIFASAGSGKTYQLTHRYIALMAQDLRRGLPPRPERIVALTFTRKAAGEFFESILHKLARGARSEEEAAKLCPPPDDPLHDAMRHLRSEDYRVLLRAFVRRMPALFLGTLDSLFAAILRGFPAEFGLPGGFDVLDEHRGQAERFRVFRQVFRQALLGEEETGRDFIEVYRRATIGRGELGVREQLDQYVEQCHSLYLQAPDGRHWGDRRVIWPRSRPGWPASDFDWEAEFGRMLTAFERSPKPPSEASLVFWEGFREKLKGHSPGLPLPDRVKFFLEKAGAAWADLEAGEATLTVNRGKHTLDPIGCQHFRTLILFVCGREIEARLEQTRGIHSLLALYEEHYSQLVRRRGRLTFADLEVLLSPRRQGRKTRVLTQQPDEDQRLRIDYRLDARYDHWLLDEFQDTSFLQWSVIENLIDEAVQDDSGERSLFQVGDLKQAIYGWRGGDTRLFEMLRRRYPHVASRPLDESRRSGPDVIGMVNHLFGSPALLREAGLPEETVSRWPWGEHRVAEGNEHLPGHAVLLHPVPTEGEKATDEDVRGVVVALLDEIRPIERGLTCAILVQSNKEGLAIVDHVRACSRTQVPIMADSEIAVASSTPLNLALVDLLRLAAHPGDGFAEKHLNMTPFSRVFAAGGLSPAQVGARVRRGVLERGFEETLRHWLLELRMAGVALDAFSDRRASDLLLAARSFDETGSRDADEFLAYLENYTTRDPDMGAAVQVLTIHKSKGLTFDMVLLPDLGGRSLSQVRESVAVKRGADRFVEWVLHPPPKAVVELDPVLGEHREETEAEAGYESLCKFYVALTRARHANYLIAPQPSKSSTSRDFNWLLRTAYAGDAEAVRLIGDVEVLVGGESRAGTTDEHWYLHRETKVAPAAGVEDDAGGSTALLEPLARLRPRRRTPSSSERRLVPAKTLLFRERWAAQELGNLVHGLFEQIEWAGDLPSGGVASLESLLPALLQSLPETVRKEAAAHVARCLAEPKIHALLSRPAGEGAAECWREKRFEILLGQEWLSGAFDRVILTRDPADGRFTSAVIVDYKTDTPKDDPAGPFAASVETYRPQIQTYRQVLARMTGLPPERIAARLVFTRAAWMAEL